MEIELVFWQLNKSETYIYEMEYILVSWPSVLRLSVVTSKYFTWRIDKN